MIEYYNEFTNFLKNSIWGLILLGGFGSILGTILIVLTRKIYFWLAKNYAVFRTKKYFEKIIELYSKGYISGFASKSDVHQTILNGKLIINTIINSTVLIIILIIAFGLFSILNFELFWIVALILGVLLVFPIMRIKNDLWFINKNYDDNFDKEEIQKKAEEFLSKSLKSQKAKVFAKNKLKSGED
ncbi:hypothetical protein BX611_0004 [Lutibacter oceani]|uniref:Uncharacterized protein n=1 Tax=Lutibacter oceani TaxID=1853311 RepID=A0A3D9S3I1_9FLAO|nr:hypothetical protein [Lutibacter oceani]REE84464.1 hypothetical protein BX611_0004 [Lutibacter oceani]